MGIHPGESVPVLLTNNFKQFTDDEALKFEESKLEEKYPDFKNLMQEYHDGILLFDLTDKKVWTKAVADTTGLDAYHKANSSKYMWNDRVRVATYTCLDAKAKKEAMKMANAGKSAEEIKAKLNKKMTGTVVISENKYEKTDSQGEKYWNQKGVIDVPVENNVFKFYRVEGIVGPEPKSLKEARGLLRPTTNPTLKRNGSRS